MTETYDHIDMTYDNDSGELTASSLTVLINKASLSAITLNVTFTGSGYPEDCTRKAVHLYENRKKHRTELVPVELTLSSGSLYTGTASLAAPFSVSYFRLPIQILIETDEARYYSLNKLDFMVRVRNTK